MKFKLLAFLPILLLASCVSKKSFVNLQEEKDLLMDKYNKLASKCQEEKSTYASADKANKDRINKLEAQLQSEKDNTKRLGEQVDFLKKNNTNLLDRLSDLSVISQASAESIKASLETLNKQSDYIQNMTESIQRKDSMNLALVMNLKRSLGDVNDEDVKIEVKKGVVYISLSDKLLFSSGSARISSSAQTVLGKIAKVINDHNELDVLVEGHTDNVPIKTECIQDNWELSVKRATAVVRTLQNKYNVDPARMTAGGRSEFLPKEENTTSAGRRSNRRTEIIILPKLDQFFKLFEAQQ
jgi:chemotaxis protein MotB